MPNDDALERLAKKINSQNKTTYQIERKSFPPPQAEDPTPHRWNEPEKPMAHIRKRFSPLEIFFGASVIFFLVAVLLSGLLLFSGSNTVSTKNVGIAVSGPTEIGAGDTVSLQIVVSNGNAVPMQLTDLVVEFPPGTRSDADVSVELPRIRKSLGTIAPGTSVNETVKAVIFGSEGSHAISKISVEYRVPSSNAVFVSDATYDALVTQAPASITIDTLKEAVSGQDVTMTVSVHSNVSSVISNALLLASYPPGFSFKSSKPAASAGQAAWSLGDIEPGGERTVTITGVFTGEDKDTRVIHFNMGQKKTGQEAAIAAPLASGDATVTVVKPFISVSLALNGKVGTELSVGRGEIVRGDIQWSNNLPVKVQNLEIKVSLQGAILDRTKVSAERGFYKSSDNSIAWNGGTDPTLADVEAGASGVASFSFATLPVGQGDFRNPELSLLVTVNARRISETNVPETVQSSASARVVVATDVSLTSYLSHTAVFPNTGPIPPKADTETLYTVTWAVSNTANALANASVSAILPSYVRWTGQISPTGESVSFNPVGGAVTWNIGDVGAGQSKTVSFQIGITPSLSQVGTSPSVLGDQHIDAYDRFIRGTLTRTAPALTTASGAVSQQAGIVVP